MQQKPFIWTKSTLIESNNKIGARIRGIVGPYNKYQNVFLYLNKYNHLAEFASSTTIDLVWH